jgi:hypothetical protein
VPPNHANANDIGVPVGEICPVCQSALMLPGRLLCQACGVVSQGLPEPDTVPEGERTGQLPRCPLCVSYHPGCRFGVGLLSCADRECLNPHHHERVSLQEAS